MLVYQRVDAQLPPLMTGLRSTGRFTRSTMINGTTIAPKDSNEGWWPPDDADVYVAVMHRR